MSPVNPPSTHQGQTTIKPRDIVDPTTQPLTVAVSLETTADQLGLILGGLASFIPANVASLTVDVSVGTSPPPAGG